MDKQQQVKKFRRFSDNRREFLECDGFPIKIKNFEFMELFVHEGNAGSVQGSLGWAASDNFKRLEGWCVSENSTGFLITDNAKDPEEAYFLTEKKLNEKGVENAKAAMEAARWKILEAYND